MTSTYKQIVGPKFLESVQTTQYTANNCKTNIIKATLTNTTGVNATFSLHIVPTGGIPGSNNVYIKDQAIAPDQTYKCPEIIGHGLESGWFISAIASVASALRLSITANEIT